MNSDATDASFNDRSCPLSVSGCCFRLFSRSSSLLFILQSHVDKHPRGTPSSLACGMFTASRNHGKRLDALLNQDLLFLDLLVPLISFFHHPLLEAM